MKRRRALDSVRVTRRLSLLRAESFQRSWTRARISNLKGSWTVMAYIVDGNNVMGQTPGWHRDKSKSRRGLLEQLAAFARAKKARVTVVFDGAPDKVAPEGSAFR